MYTNENYILLGSTNENLIGVSPALPKPPLIININAQQGSKTEVLPKMPKKRGKDNLNNKINA